MASSNTPIPVDDGFNEYESALKRQKSTTSKVWDEMTKLECENKNELKAQCNHCKKGVPSIKNYKFDADECCQAIFTFLVCDKHSFRTVEEPGFRYMMRIYVTKSKSTSSSLAGSSNVSDKNPVDSGLDEHNDNSADFVGYFDESDDYKRYLNESSTRSEKSQLDIYLEEPELELNSEIDVLDYWSKSSVRNNELSLLARDLLAIPTSTVASESAFSMGKKVITPLRSLLKPKTVQAVVCLDDWMRAKGFSAGNY
ncbi:hypothetical protein Gotur_034501, partial [Gossypium turneri]